MALTDNSATKRSINKKKAAKSNPTTPPPATTKSTTSFDLLKTRGIKQNDTDVNFHVEVHDGKYGFGPSSNDKASFSTSKSTATVLGRDEHLARFANGQDISTPQATTNDQAPQRGMPWLVRS